jgi:hypothetical protein
MIRILSGITETLVAIGAFLVVAVCTVIGAYVPWPVHPQDVHLAQVLGTAIGCVAGFLLAGLIFGPIAVLIDIRNILRKNGHQ